MLLSCCCVAFSLPVGPSISFVSFWGVRFRRAVQFNDNDAGDFGGGIALEGGDVT